VRIEEQLAPRFVCPKCHHAGASSRRFAATGTGISKLFDIQHNKFVALTCRNCGFTEVYDPRVLEGKDHLGTILDVIFEP